MKVFVNTFKRQIIPVWDPQFEILSNTCLRNTYYDTCNFLPNQYTWRVMKNNSKYNKTKQANKL